MALGPQGVTLQAGARLSAQVIRGIGDEVVVVRGAAGAFNESTGAYAGTESEVYAGAARVRREQVSQPDAGGGEVTVSATTILLPFGTDGVAVGDVVRVTVSRDQTLVGREFRVTDVPADSAGTSLRLSVESVR